MEDCEPRWFYRSDDDPLNKEACNMEWKEYEDSEVIENAYSDYIYALEGNADVEDYKIYAITDSQYSIDFDKNLQISNEDKYKSRLVGRFIGDPQQTQNTLQERNIKFHQLERKAYKLVPKVNQVIKSSLILESEQAFIDYLYLDIVFKITEKTQDNDQAKEDLYMFCIFYINSYENDKEIQLKELKQFIEDVYVGRLKNNAVIWYSKDSFVYRMVNVVLRKQNFVEIFWIRYLINVLRIGIETLSKLNPCETLYRGSRISKNEMKQMQNQIGKPFLLNGFTSTTADMNIAKGFMKNDNKEQFESVLFIFEVEEVHFNKTSSIRNISRFPHEEEFLLNMNNFFKTTNIEFNSEGEYYKVYLKFSALEEVKSTVNPKTLSYQETLQQTLKTEYSLDCFYLADVLVRLVKGDEILYLFQNVRIYNDINSANILNYLGQAYHKKGDYEKANEYYTKSLEIYLVQNGVNNTDTANLYNNIGMVFNKKGDHERAIEYVMKSLEIYKELFGENHPEIPSFYYNIGNIYACLEDYNKAQEFHTKSLELRINYLGEYDPDLAASYNSLGLILMKKKDYEEAIEILSKSLDINLATLGENHPDTATLFNNIGFAYHEIRDYDKAIENYLKSLEITLNTSGKNDPDLISTYKNIGKFYYDQKNYKEAIQYYKKLLRLNQNYNGENHVQTAASYRFLGLSYLYEEKEDKAKENLKKSLEIYIATKGENHPDTAQLYDDLGLLSTNNNDYDEAIEYFNKSLEMRISNLGESNSQTANSFQQLGIIYYVKKDYDNAKQFLTKAFEIYLEICGENHSQTKTTLKYLQKLEDV